MRQYVDILCIKFHFDDDDDDDDDDDEVRFVLEQHA